jgi:hypothetical protein
MDKQRQADCDHLYRVTSPIDGVEVCQWCGARRPCEAFAGDEYGPELKKDQA